MKANEFIKRQGLAEARRVLHDARGCVGVKLWGRYEFSTEDLKRLIKSHEWIGLCGGLEDARALAVVHNDAALFESIADVESCMEVSSEFN